MTFNGNCRLVLKLAVRFVGAVAKLNKHHLLSTPLIVQGERRFDSFPWSMSHLKCGLKLPSMVNLFSISVHTVHN